MVRPVEKLEEHMGTCESVRTPEALRTDFDLAKILHVCLFRNFLLGLSGPQWQGPGVTWRAWVVTGSSHGVGARGSDILGTPNRLPRVTGSRPASSFAALQCFPEARPSRPAAARVGRRPRHRGAPARGPRGRRRRRRGATCWAAPWRCTPHDVCHTCAVLATAK